MAAIEGKRARSLRVLEAFSETIREAERRLEEDLKRVRDVSPARNYSEKAWLLMLADRGIVPAGDAARILRAIAEYEAGNPEEDAGSYVPSDSFSIWSLEKKLTGRLGADLAGNLNIGKTLPEPIARLKIRDACIPVMDALLELLSSLHPLASRYRHSVMPGYTHLAQAQLTTFGHYLLSLHDPLHRALVELEAAYANTNQSTLGCGALAGTSWPISRPLVAELLGFDGVVENTNDCVASADYGVSTVAALVNVMLPISRVTLDLQFWGSEEVNMIGVPESYSDTSSMMPQKKNFGGQLERVRQDAATIIARFQEVATLTHNEPFADMLPVLRARFPVLDALCVVRRCLTVFQGFLSTLVPNERRMESLSREGFAAAAELANIMVRRNRVSYRQAHHVAGTVVRMAVQRGITADRVNAALLDEAATAVLGEPASFSDAEVHEALDPRHFVESHDVSGGVAPMEVERMVKDRIARIEEAAQRQRERKERLAAARKRLQERIDALVG
jgi:argininosuccinate lyase